MKVSLFIIGFDDSVCSSAGHEEKRRMEFYSDDTCFFTMAGNLLHACSDSMEIPEMDRTVVTT